MTGPRARRWQLVALVMLGALACGKNRPGVARPDELVRRYQACWTAYNAGRWGKVAACYPQDYTLSVPGLAGAATDSADWVADAKQHGIVALGDRGEPELVVVADGWLLGVVRVAGTDGGQPVGVRLAELIEYDARGKVTRHEQYYDLAARTRPPAAAALRVVIADDQLEAVRANEATVGALLDAWRDGRIDAVGALMTDDVVWTEAALDLHLDKAGLLAHLAGWRQALHDGGLDLNQTYFGRDFVIVRGALDGENDGDVPALGISLPSPTASPTCAAQRRGPRWGPRRWPSCRSPPASSSWSRSAPAGSLRPPPRASHPSRRSSSRVWFRGPGPMAPMAGARVVRVG